MRRLTLSLAIAPVLLTGLLALAQAQIPDRPMDADSTATTGTALASVVSIPDPFDQHIVTTNYLSGHDFSAFFDAYIYGNDPLPCHVDAGELVIDFGTMPAIPQLSTGTVQGYVYEQDNVTPVSNACVDVSSTAPDYNEITSFCCTEPDGGFAVTNLPVGDVYVKTRADCNGAHPNLIDEWYADGGSTPDGALATPVAVITGQITSDVDFTLDLAGAISGHVFEADGMTVITDTLISVHAHGVTPDSSSLGAWVSQADGSYTITGLISGTYKVQANNNLAPGYVTKYYDDKLTWDEADTIEVLAGQVITGIDFTLKQITSADLDYVLAIDDPSSGQAVVTMTVSNLSADTFEVEEHGYHGLYVNVLALSAYDASGNPLTAEHLPDSGSSYSGQQADVWRVQCAGLSEIVIEYTVQPGLGDEHRGYIAPDFAALAGEYVFLVPRDSATDLVAVSFNLPTGWIAYAPWTLQGDSYDPAIPEGDAIDSLSVSDFALGQFDVYTQAVGTTEVAVAAYRDWPTAVKEELAQRSWDIFAYETAVFGRSVGDYYLAIFCPVAPDGHDIYVGEWSTSQGYSIRFEEDGSYWGRWDMFAHQIFHRWNCWSPWGIHGYRSWFVEGPDVFYEMKTVTELRIQRPYGNMEDQLLWYYDRYLEDYVATGNDRPLISQDLTDFLIYRKGAMVAFLLAKEIYLRTDGTHNFDGFLQVLVQKYGHHVAPCSEECLKAELAALTGTDFTQFFEDYVYGTTTLPMDWAFEDDDGDGLSNALEIGWDTHPEDQDTDGDGYSDGVEITAGSDPLDPSSVPPAAHIVKLVTPEGQVDYGDELTYTLVISAVPGIQVGLYDPLVGTTFLRFVEQPPGVSQAGGVITGTVKVTPSNRITVSFVAQVGVPGTAGWVVDVINRACIYPFGGTLGICTWSNEVINSAFRPYHIYLPIALRNY